jgi:LDH2 family malate/lactate/ureidoglycolate dehydrogenase
LSNELLQIPSESLMAQLGAVFEAWEMLPERVQVCAERMVEADLMGIDSHGVGMLPQYEINRKNGSLIVNAPTTVERDIAAVALIDAGHGMGHVAATQAMELAIEKAMTFGIALVTVRNSNHYGAAGVYSNMARREGLIGISTTGTTQRSVVPTFGREPRFSTNPIAFAAPGSNSNGFSLDMATSTVAVGKLKVAKRAEKPIPVGWTVDSSGQPETDPGRALDAIPKRLTPLGGTRDLGSHKGYGLAMMVEILSSVLSGSYIGGYDLATDTRGKFINVGHCFIVIDPELVRGEGDAFPDELERLTTYLRATPAADPAQPVLVPGDTEWASMKDRSEGGIPMTRNLFEEVREVTQSCGAPFILEPH